MSHTIIIDESNGNGIVNILPQTTTTGTGDSVNGIITSTVLVTSISNEDLSQSCSEYTDADESMSAPTEFLAEFLSAVMLRNYKKALKYCKLILQFEPNNITAKEFYPLIEEKVKQLGETTSSESDENYNNTSSGAAGGDLGDIEMGLGATGVTTATDDDGGTNACCISTNRNKNLLKKTNMFHNHHNNEEDHSSISSSDDEDSSISDSDEKELNDGSNSNTSNSTSASDNTTHSYSSLLLEDEDDASPAAAGVGNIILPFNNCDLDLDDNHHHQHQGQLQSSQQQVPSNILLNKNDLSTNELIKLKDAFNGNGNYVTTSCSDSESPTEPLTQKIAAILRSKCLPPPAREDT